MTLLETERLIRKMTELLEQGGNPDLAPKLAGDYAAACHAANLRLQQCEGMIKAGDRHQAIQLAETVPNLLDLVTILEFRNADHWRSFCQQNSLPAAERIDARSVHAMNDCYALGITTDHPLYAAYRKAVLNRNDEEALQALQSITRLNPTDGNAASELARLDAKVLAARLDSLGGLVEGGDSASVVAGIDAIESFGFKSRPEGEVWCAAETIRCGFMLEQAAELKAASQWMDVLAKTDFIRRLQKDLKLELPSVGIKQLEIIEAWAKEEQEKDRKDREFRGLIAELNLLIQQSEDKDTSARYVDLPELRDDFESLNKVWRSLEDFTRPIPEDATAAFRKRSDLLEAEIFRRTAIRRRIILTSSATVFIVGAAIVWFVMRQMQTRDFTKELQAAVSQRQVRVAEHLIDRVRTSEKRLLNVSSVNAALGNADSFVAKEHALLTSFEMSFSELPKQLAGDPDSTRINAIADQLTQTRKALDALAPDLKTENEPRVETFERQWQQYLSEGGAVVNKLLEEWISSAENQGAQLDYRTPIEKAAAQIAKLSDVIQKINECEAGFKGRVELRSDLLQRAAAARAKFVAYNQELGKISDGLAAIKKAATFGDFSSAITLIASSEFSTTPAVSAANSVQSVGASEEATLRALLGASNATTWAYITQKKNSSFIPEIAMPVEQDLFNRLRADPVVSASHQHYRIWMGSDNARSEEWITEGSIDKSEGWKSIKVWTPSATATSAAFVDRDYGFFGGTMKLSPTQIVGRLENIPDMNDASELFASALGKVYTGGTTYGGPLLTALDTVKDSRDGSPVFRAYLLCRLVEIMEFQPDDWGLSFCPSARRDVLQIQNIVAGQVESGDWFVPSKLTSWNEKLNQFFDSEKTLSYAKKAEANLALARSIAKDGLHYVGFVGIDRKPVLAVNPTPAEMWVYDATHKSPVLFSGSAMPLSPLFALPASRAEYLARAGIDANASTFTDSLPPLFRVNTKP